MCFFLKHWVFYFVFIEYYGSCSKSFWKFGWVFFSENGRVKKKEFFGLFFLSKCSNKKAVILTLYLLRNWCQLICFSGLTRRQRFNFISEVVEETAAALVYIEIKDMGVRDYMSGEPMTRSNGSGFIIDPEGLILTNAHVVINKPRAKVQVRLQDGRTFQGKNRTNRIVETLVVYVVTSYKPYTSNAKRPC